MSGYAGRRVLVAGAGVAGTACVEILLAQGARVSLLERRETPTVARLREAGAAVVLGDEVPTELLAGIDDVVVSPGFAPHAPVVRAAFAAGLPVYSEPELAWRLRPPGAPAWLAVTGTNGKTTTTTMVESILRAAGLRSAALGNIGEPLVFAAADPDRYEVLAVELSSFQLHWSQTLAPPYGALLNLADDHLEWHGTFDAYAQAKLAIWRSVTAAPDAARYADGAGVPDAAAGSSVAVGNLDDPAVARALRALTIAGPARRVGVTMLEPDPGQVGVADGVLVDHAFAAGPVELVALARIRPAGAHNISNALHAATLARAYGVSPAAVAAGLAGYQPQPHRNTLIATVAGVDYVDDSKATNPHAALASLTAYPRVIWVAGGQLKGVETDELVAAVADRLAGVVLLGVDRHQIAAELRRHAPQIPIVDVARTDDGAMAEVVAAAAGMARTGDTVLLAPAAASKDMFTSFVHRGDAFAAAVRAMAKAAT